MIRSQATEAVSLSKLGTRLLASLGNEGKERNSLLASEMPVPIPR